MTEDEAFIRKIVDSPGDDLPRLVYADWLDEQNDPRGAYLRAEAEWAKTKQTTGLLRLNGLAEGLDPVWVARVSRPPEGVCCDHLRFSGCGPLLSLDELRAFERSKGSSFPDAYRAFLLNYNAGLAESPNTKPVSEAAVESHPVICFRAVGHSYKTRLESVQELEPIPAGHARFAHAEVAYNASELSRILIRFAEPYRGCVFVECTVKPESAFGGQIPLRATSLPEYLAELLLVWGPVRKDVYDI